MSVVDAMRNQQKKKDEEEEKKVVGQQQKTQSNANKPTGSTSIPKQEKKEDQSSGSIRTENNVTTAGRSANNRDNGTRSHGNGNYGTDRVRVSESTATLRREREKADRRRRGVADVQVSESTERLRRARTISKNRQQPGNRQQPRNDGYEDNRWGSRSQFADFGASTSPYTIPGVDMLPTAEEVRRSRMTDAERIQDMMRAAGMGQMSGTGQTQPSQNSLALPEFKGMDVPQNNVNIPQWQGVNTSGGSQFKTPVFNPVTQDNKADQEASIGIKQLDNLEDYIQTNNPQPVDPKENEEFWKAQLMNYLQGGEQVKQAYEQGKNSSAADSFWTGVNKGSSGLGAALVSKVNSYGDALGNFANDLLGLPEATPEQAYERTIGSEKGVNKIASMFTPSMLRQDLETYQNYVAEKYNDGTVTQEDLDRLKQMQEIVDRNDFLGRTEHNYEKLVAENRGASESHPIANLAGQMVPATMQNMAGSELAGAVTESLPALTGVAKKAANDAIELTPDIISDIIPSIEDDIASGKSQNEVLQNALGNLALNYGFNKLTDIGGKLVSKAAKKASDSINTSNMAKQTAETIPELAEQKAMKEMPGVTLGGKTPEQIAAERDSIIDQLMKYANGDLNEEDLINLGKTPQYMSSYGNTDNPLVMKQSSISKIAYPQGYMGGKHDLGYQPIAEIPDLINDPAMVFDSATQPNSGIVMTNLIDNKGNPVIAPIHMDKDSHMGNVNEVASMYGRNKIENLLENSDILYENKEKARDALSGVGLQLPELKTTADPFLNSNVAEQGKNINNALPTLEDLLPRAAEKQATQDMIPGAELFTDSNAAKPQIANDTAMTTEDLWAQLSGQKPLNEAGVRRVGEGTPYNEQGQKLSKLHQTLQNTDKLTDEEKRIFADKNGFWYDPDNEKALAAQAQDSVSRDIDEVYRQYTGDDLDIGKLSGEDAHKMFTASYDYSRMAQEAVKNGDQAAADLYNQKARNIMLNAREAATKGGQFNAAIRYYSNTPQGIINKAYDVLDKDITKFKANNPKLSGSIDEVSKQLAGRLKDIDTDAIMTGTDEAAKENLRSQVINALEEISKNTKNKELKNVLSDLSPSDVDALINSKYAGDIAKQIDMFSMGAFGVKPETLDKVLDIFDEAEKYGINSKQYYKLEQDAYTLLANDLADGKSFRDKLDAWRYFSMLSAPLTHIRNTVGNTTNNVLTGMKNTLSAAIEAAADRVTKANGGLDGGRTKSILNALDGADRSLIKLAGDDFDSNAYRQFKQSGNKYINVARNLENAGDVWKDKGLGKILNKITGANEYMLDAEDTLFGKAKYQTSLAGFLKANGADSNIFNATDEASMELLAQAREYALKQANEATFHQSNAFANWYSQGVQNLRDSDKAGMRALGNVANASMPFVKTPSNILAQGWQYSPTEFLNVAADTMKLKKGTMKGTEFIDDLSKALTGSGMVAFGALLAHEGVIAIGNGDEEEDKFNDKRGVKRLSLHVGDNYIDISQLAPGAIPLLEGAVIYETIRNNRDGNGAAAVDAVLTGAATIGNTVTDMTLLKGISDIMSAARYSESSVDMAAQVGTKIAGNYASQLMPTLGAKIEKTIDDTKRTSYTDKQGTFSKALDQQGRYLKTKIPFLQEAGEKLEGSDNETLAGIGDFLTNEPQIDSWGNEVKVQDYGNGTLGRFANNFLNPLDTTTDQHDRVDEELRSLYSEVKDPKVLNFGMTDSKESKVDDHKMTDKEWTQYQKTTGSLKHELAENFMDSEGYAELDGDTKTEAYNKLKGFAKAYSLNEMGLKAPSKSNQALIDAYKEGGAGAVIDSVIGDSAAKAAGVRSNSAAAAEIQESIESGDTEGAQKKADAAQQLKDIGLGYSAPQKAYYDALEGNPDLSVEQFAETYKKLDANGNQSIAQGEFIDYLNANHVSEKDAAALIKDYYPKDKTKIPTLEDGTWKAKKPEQGATQSQTVTDNKTGSYTGSKADIKLDNPTGNATMDAKLKAKQAMREEAKAGKTYDPLDPGNSLPNANYDLPDASSWSVNVSGKSYDLHDSKGYQKAQSLGIPDNTWLQMYKATDTNGNGRNTKDETKAYIEQLVKLGTIDKSQRADYFDMLNGTKAKNPYR